uniref:Uncharacterized protein n=1 Tax=Rhizophora mucronata TaxID=61149 RepID=A0A2P2QSX7_RHIMU
MDRLAKRVDQQQDIKESFSITDLRVITRD